MATIRIGCAGWAIPKEHASSFESDGSLLTRYASCFDAVEINSSFYRPHQPTTYARWASSVPEDFHFAVKAPKEVTHQRKLVDSRDVLIAFLKGIENLGAKLGPVLFQFPPSFQFQREVTENFFDLLRSQFSGPAVCEPRHPTWFTTQAAHVMEQFHIGRVAADPCIAEPMEPGGWGKTAYYRLHGSPQVYYSNYPRDFLNELIEKLPTQTDAEEIWCIFDNTAAGCATENALFVKEHLKAHD